MREAGYSDVEITEIIALVGLKTFINDIHHVAWTDVDFPKVKVLTPATSLARQLRAAPTDA
ncbi:MAG: hypothetical protein GTO51_08780 [Candidatus Latescibacteria bacterium]|nr:hypothetical protein [Candidatus Latescibacterota bacterium]NIM66065.1 hypothetical protein [Candidatus Latescibacterota bacterium]NIO02473.1 hypothetical protein [Candidatus Latescibacterota bacterium]NIO29384.1 hypothetical protein [Candidatus Latescibacterota bacterium]NIO57102.1 hypothetical protein [Candidatus Latescibacterota bacterium]